MVERLATAIRDALAARPRTVLDRPDSAPAAVLVPILAIEDEPHLLFTRRSTSLPHHQGQVAFPGGRRHDDDVDLRATALREAHEEIGLDPADVRILGALDDIETIATRFVITPWVGLVPYPYAWRPCEHEVDTIFTVPLRVLQAPETLRRETWDFGGRQVPIDVYPVDGHVIWGATQRITQDLLNLLATLS
jgi:8-oxo-dGTP pyrophosphatase MutT (NUDIX family)